MISLPMASPSYPHELGQHLLLINRRPVGRSIKTKLVDQLAPSTDNGNIALYDQLKLVLWA